MGIELQIRSVSLGDVIGRSVQQVLRTGCFESGGTVYVDHADVAGPVEFAPTDGTVQARVPVDVYLVAREAVLAAPNGVPDGAIARAGRVAIVLELAVKGSTISLQCIDVELADLAAVAGAAAPMISQAIVASVGSPLSTDLAQQLSLLGLPDPATSTVELTGRVVLVRFDPQGAGVDRVPPGYDWGLFLDEGAVVQLARELVDFQVPAMVTSLDMTPHWRPVGERPHVDVDYVGKANVPDPASGDFDGTFFCDLAVSPSPAQRLRTNVIWSFHLDPGPFAPAFLTEIVEDLLASMFNPTMFGGSPAGDHAFVIESRLPDIALAGARFEYGGVVASPEGMTIGGQLRVMLDPSSSVLATSVTPFTVPHFEVWASDHGCAFGWGGYTPSTDEMKISAAVGLEGVGHFCGYEVVPADDTIASYIRHNPVSVESQTLGVEVPLSAASSIVDPVQLIVRTSRGVRFIDFGVPTVQVDDGGTVVDAVGAYIDDCLYVDMWTLYWIELPVDPITGRPLPPPDEPWPPPDWEEITPNWLTDPAEVIDWDAYIEGLGALNVQVVNVTGLEPGELLQLRTFDRALDVTADSGGRALIPVVRSYRDRLEPAKLVRASRQSFEGLVSTRTAIFHREARLPAGYAAELVSTGDDAATVVTNYEDRVDAYRIESRGAWTRVAAGDLKAVRKGSPAAVELPGMASITRIPGFADEPLAIATMDDGQRLLLDLANDGAPRVAGTFIGPVGELDVADNWALATGPDRLIVYRVTRA
ncbi:MAG: hypothetical protein ACRDO1_04905 [Nocardioidaceae bacterium]